MTKVIVTGGNGLIANSLIRSLSSKYDVLALTSQVSENTDTNSNISYLTIDLSKDWSIKDLPEKSDVIFHFAQSPHFRDFPLFASDVFNVNTLSTLKLLDYARNAGVKTFVYASSGGIYGNSEFGFSEDAPIVSRNDLGFYLTTKLCSELLIENYSDFFKIIILRFFFVYGKGQRNTMLIPRLVDSVRSSKKITLQGHNGISINPIHVNDAVKAIEKSAELNSSQKINIAGPEILTLRSICDIIGKKIQQEPVFEIHNTESKNLIGDIKKMSEMLVPPQIKFENGIEDLI